MKNFWAFGHRLKGINKPLFGDREKFGLKSDRTDPMWIEWEEVCSKFYAASQRTGSGKIVNDAGYRILRDFDFSGKTLLEIGPGHAPHLSFFKSLPGHYIIADIRREFLESASEQLDQMGVSHETRLIDMHNPARLPLEPESVDVLLTFYSLEHLYPLEEFAAEYQRVLRPGGHLIGGIPAEGGLAWGLGRLMTSRRWLKKNTNINPDKLICWEHPNFADHILTTLATDFEFTKTNYWPLLLPLIDANLIISFIARKKDKVPGP